MNDDNETHPTQPVYTDPHGVYRFKPNGIVQYLLESGPFDMNHLARMTFSEEDRRQFAQLIGYSVDGYNDLSYVPWEEGIEVSARYRPFSHKQF